MAGGSKTFRVCLTCEKNEKSKDCKKLSENCFLHGFFCCFEPTDFLLWVRWILVGYKAESTHFAIYNSTPRVSSINRTYSVGNHYTVECHCLGLADKGSSSQVVTSNTTIIDIKVLNGNGHVILGGDQLVTNLELHLGRIVTNKWRENIVQRVTG